MPRSPHVVFVGTDPDYLFNLWGEIIRSFVRDGFHVTAVTADATVAQIERLEGLGAQWRHVPIRRNGLSVLQDLRAFWALRGLFVELAPDIVLAYTVKPIIWGGLALPRCTRFIAVVTGLGFAFFGRTLRRAALRKLVTTLYRRALRNAAVVVFQNPDNRADFLKRKLVDPKKTRVIRGFGVNLNHFAQQPLPAGPTRFLVMARLLGEKGLREYAQAALAVKQRHPEAIFRLAGRFDESPDGIGAAELKSWTAVEYLGELRDVRAAISDVHVYVLPSYHEGLPQSTVEALAIGRPVLTTDAPGCRETVLEGENGFLVPAADVPALASRIEWFIDNPHRLAEMAQRSRDFATERFDCEKINQELRSLIEGGVKA